MLTEKLKIRYCLWKSGFKSFLKTWVQSEQNDPQSEFELASEITLRHIYAVTHIFHADQGQEY